MKTGLLFVILTCVLLLFGCAPSPEEIATQTAAAATITATSWTQTPTETFTPTATYPPTPTFTHTPSLTPTPTKTPTPTRTPLGGGSGQIACNFCGNGTMSLVEPDGTNPIRISDGQSIGVSFEWSSNGASLGYFEVREVNNERKGVTCVIDGETLKEKCLEVGGGGFALSPDGKELLFGNYSKGLFIVNIESGEHRTLTSGNINYYPDWSPDGTKIVYQKSRSIFVINVDGTNETLMVQNGNYPIWSPDGQIIYQYDNYLILLNDNGTKDRLTQKLQAPRHFQWTRDGKYLFFMDSTGGSMYSPAYDLFSFEFSTRKLTQLTNHHQVFRFTLSPDSTLIALGTGTYQKEGGYYVSACFKTSILRLDGSLVLEWNDNTCGGMLGPWRPVP